MALSLMETAKIAQIELDLLLDAILRRYGLDFRNYAKTSIGRCVHNAMAGLSCGSISEMTKRVLYEPAFFRELVSYLSITVSEMFRDPPVYKAIRETVIPYLATYPFIKIWHAGCSAGEEVYSLAILLKETGLYDKSTIYATDFNDKALAKAKEGIYPIAVSQKWSANYHQSGGDRSLTDYFYADYDSICINRGLKKNITFANHNLAVDGVFGEMHMVLCRNVMIYFDQNLQNKALKLFSDSLIRDGFLCIGGKESLRFSEVFGMYSDFNSKLNIYRKKADASC